MIRLSSNLHSLFLVSILTVKCCHAIDHHKEPPIIDSQLFGSIMEHIDTFPHIDKAMISNLFNTNVPITSFHQLLQYYRNYDTTSQTLLGFNSKMLPFTTIQYIWARYVRVFSIKAKIGMLAYHISGPCYHIVEETEKFHENKEQYTDFYYEGSLGPFLGPKISILENTLFSSVQKSGLDTSMLTYRKQLVEFWHTKIHNQTVPIALVSVIANWKTHVIAYEGPTKLMLVPDFPLEAVKGIKKCYVRPTILSTSSCLQKIDTQLYKAIDKGKVETVEDIEQALGYIYAYETTRKIRERDKLKVQYSRF